MRKVALCYFDQPSYNGNVGRLNIPAILIFQLLHFLNEAGFRSAAGARTDVYIDKSESEQAKKGDGKKERFG